MHFVTTDKGEPGYGRSTLWTGHEWRRHLISGAEQAFATRLPEVTHGRPLADMIATLPGGGTRIALDNYESPGPLSALAMEKFAVLALGPERGWSAKERELLRAHAFAFAHLGFRILRAETAVVVAVAIVKARRGLM
jgi:RsmE family RNA methyltransferase